MTQTYRVAGMTCAGCVSAVTHAVRRLDPKAAVTVDLAGGKGQRRQHAGEGRCAARGGSGGVCRRGRVSGGK